MILAERTLHFKFFIFIFYLLLFSFVALVKCAMALTFHQEENIVEVLSFGGV